MAELEADMDNAEIENSAVAAAPSSQRRVPGGVLPPGAVPSQNGVLSSHAAEFWFPECRDCPCCKGFKHGCKCRTASVTTCQDPACGSSATVPSAPAPHQPQPKVRGP